MKYVRQLCVILLVSLCGELLGALLPLPVPASIYALVLMLAGLATGLIPLASVRDTGKFLLEVMPVMFIPAAVGLVDSFGLLRPVLVPVATVTLVTTVLVMAGTGRITQAVIRRGERRRRDADAPR